MSITDLFLFKISFPFFNFADKFGKGHTHLRPQILEGVPFVICIHLNINSLITHQDNPLQEGIYVATIANNSNNCYKDYLMLSIFVFTSIFMDGQFQFCFTHCRPLRRIKNMWPTKTNDKQIDKHSSYPIVTEELQTKLKSSTAELPETYSSSKDCVVTPHLKQQDCLNSDMENDTGKSDFQFSSGSLEQ